MFTRKRKKLEARREEVLSRIHGERLAFETMMQRAQATGEVIDTEFAQNVLTLIADYEQKARQEISIDNLDDLSDDAEEKGQLRAYICPAEEVRGEGHLSIDRIEEWNVPKIVISRLRDSQGKAIDNADKNIKSARGALLKIFQEYDSWSSYTDEYEETMLKCTYLILLTIVVLLLAAIFSLRLPSPFSTIFVVLLSGAVGSCASVMAKMPELDVRFSGELVSYKRRIWSRIGVGSIGSLICCALLGWGILPIAIHGQTFADVLEACYSATQGVPCTSINALILLCVPMLFGFSERALASVEHQFLSGKS